MRSLTISQTLDSRRNQIRSSRSPSTAGGFYVEVTGSKKTKDKKFHVYLGSRRLKSSSSLKAIREWMEFNAYLQKMLS